MYIIRLTMASENKQCINALIDVAFLIKFTFQLCGLKLSIYLRCCSFSFFFFPLLEFQFLPSICCLSEILTNVSLSSKMWNKHIIVMFKGLKEAIYHTLSFNDRLEKWMCWTQLFLFYCMTLSLRISLDSDFSYKSHRNSMEVPDKFLFF